MPQYRDIPPNAKCYSQVATAGRRTLCVTVPELVECGVSENTIKVGLCRTRTGEAYCWPHHKEGNTIYLHYDGLKSKYQMLIDQRFCQGVSAEVWVTNREAQQKQKELQAICSNLPQMVEVYPEDLRELNESGLFKPENAQKIARSAGWLRLWRKLDVKTARKMGFVSVTELQTALFGLCMTEQSSGFVKFAKPIGAIRVLDRKAREFETSGLSALVGGYFGNANREMIDSVVHAVLMDLASSPLKYSFEDMAMIYNTASDYAHLPRMTVSAIKQHLNKPAHKKVWIYLRHGKLVGDSLYQPQALRDTPSRPDYLWSIDGTTMQFYYRDAQDRILSDLYVYFVADAHSGAIIGKSVAFAETSGMVTAALQEAVSKQNHIPKQVQYDNSSANVSDAVKGLIKNMSRVSFPCTPYLGRAKYIEEIIGHFQQRVQRQYKNFKGGNINTRSNNSKANPELLKWLRKNPEQLPTQEEAIAQLFEAIEEWNARGERRDNYGLWVGKSKIARYEQNYDERRTLNYFERMSLFMVKLAKPYKYTQQGIKIKVNGQYKHYVVPDPDNSAGDFIFSNENMYREFDVRINLDQPECIALLDKEGKQVAVAYEKERFKAAVADMKKGDGAKIVHFITRQKEFGYDYALKELRSQQEVLYKNGLRATGTGDYFGTNYSDKHGETFGWLDTPKTIFNAVQNEAEDRANGMPIDTDTRVRSRNAINNLKDM